MGEKRHDWATCPLCRDVVVPPPSDVRTRFGPPGLRLRRIRSDVRYPVDIPVYISGLDIVYPGRSRDLSLNGLQLHLPLKQLKEGRLAAITLSLQPRGRSRTELILPGDIRWARTCAEADAALAGIRFVHTRESMASLQQLVEAADQGRFCGRPRVPLRPRIRPLVFVGREMAPRRETRRRIKLPVLVSLEDGAVTGEVCDLSRSGLMLRSPYAVAPGRAVVVRLEAPGVPIILPVEASVRWLRFDRNEAVAGLQFRHLPDAHIVRLFFEAVDSEPPPPTPRAAPFRSASWRLAPHSATSLHAGGSQLIV